MNVCRAGLRLAHLCAHLIKGLYLSYTRLHGTQSHGLTPAQHAIIQAWLRRAAEIIGIDIQVHGTLTKSPMFIVSNHISWLDILVISSVLPVSFLSKAEVRDWMVIGTLAAKAGTLFIHRGAKHGAAEAIELMQTKLKAGHSVASFPEAKTTDGTCVHMFHARLFAAAIDTHSLIQPIALRYPHKSGVNPIVPYLDKPNIITHALQIMSAKCTVAQVTLCTPIQSNDQMRRSVAQAAKIAIERVMETAA